MTSRAPTGVTAVRGFVAGGTACGIKGSGALDLALVATASRQPVAAGGVFTTNLAVAAPVQVSRAHLADGRAAAVVLNSGNANAATGVAGLEHAQRMCARAGEVLGVAAEDVLVCSTGLIGTPLPIEAVEAGIPRVAASVGDTPEAGERAARAIMTTDTVPKQTVADARVGGTTVTVGGMAKGAAMLAPAMATMLCVLTSDAAATGAILGRALRRAVSDTFNALLVDGCTSTNDTVVALANGAAGHPVISEPRGTAFHALVEVLTQACDDLAAQMAADAEGATKLATIVVRGARSDDDARRAARAVAASQLVQCSLYGADPYWGRVWSELGASGAHVDPSRVDIAYNGFVVCRGGTAADHDQAACAAAMKRRAIEIVCDLHLGSGEARVRSTDLTHAYVDENMRTS